MPIDRFVLRAWAKASWLAAFDLARREGRSVFSIDNQAQVVGIARFCARTAGDRWAL